MIDSIIVFLEIHWSELVLTGLVASFICYLHWLWRECKKDKEEEQEKLTRYGKASLKARKENVMQDYRKTMLEVNRKFNKGSG
jgi:hypothetical protein